MSLNKTIGSGLTLDATNGIRYTGTTSEVTIASATGNLGTINIASLECGGSVRVTSASSAYTIEGFTAKADGFWFDFEAQEGVTNNCTLANKSSNATAANRMRLPLDANVAGGFIRGKFVYRNSGWAFQGQNMQRIGEASNVTVTATTADVVASGAVTITSTIGNVTIAPNGIAIVSAPLFVAGATDMTEQSSVSAPVSAHGKVWVDNGAVQSLRFTDDLGNDRVALGGTNAWQSNSGSGTGLNAVQITLNENTMYVKMTSASTWHIGGLSGGWDGRIVHIVPGSSGTGGLSHANSATPTANQISVPGGIDIQGNRFGCTLVYDAADTVWRVLGLNQL